MLQNTVLYPLPPGFKLHNDSRSLCKQVSDDFIIEAAAGRVEDNNPAPRGRPLQRDPVNGGLVKLFLKGKIDRIDGVTFVDGQMPIGGRDLLAGGQEVLIDCKGTLVMHGNNARITGEILFIRVSGSRVPGLNMVSFSWGADSIYNTVYRDNKPITDAYGKSVYPPPRDEWGTPEDWGYPDSNSR